MPCDQYRYKDKGVIVTWILSWKMFRQITWHSCHLASNYMLLDTAHCL